MPRLARQIIPVLLADPEQLLDLGDDLHVWVVDLIRIEFLHFLFGDEAALMAESLPRQVLAAVVPHFLLVASLQLLVPVLSDFEQHKRVFGLLSQEMS